MLSVSNYPKSSCPCYACDKYIYEINNTNSLPTNFSVPSCNVPSLFNCYNRIPFKHSIEPPNSSGFKILNPQAYGSKQPTDFGILNCDDKQCDTGGCNICPQTVYVSPDPRLISAGHSMQRLKLDRPPMDSSKTLASLSYDKSLDKYGQNYGSYSDINAGQITYYIDNSIKEPLFQPNFTISSDVYGTLYQDPMGAMKPQYDRYPLTSENPLFRNKSVYHGCLSSVADTSEFREDLMSRQMRKINQQRWEPRWE